MILSVDDASASDMRIADIATKYEVETVFYWPVEWRSLAYYKGYQPLNIFEAYAISKQFEIGSHTITHRHLTNISLEDAEMEIVDSKLMLEALFGKKITKFCPPRGYTNERLTNITLGLYESQRLTKGNGLVHIHPDSGANNNMPWRGYAKSIEVEELWCHSWELDKFNLWGELEEYLSENLYS